MKKVVISVVLAVLITYVILLVPAALHYRWNFYSYTDIFLKQK